MSIKRKTIQSYNSYAKKWAKKIRSGENTAHTYLEKPAMHKKITNLKGKNVLCVGCGTGEECQHLLKLGAWRVIGIDISEELINIAKKTFPKIDFQVADVEHLDFSTEEFDFVYSSLVMHYLKDWSPALKNIHRVLRPGGTFLFSTHHPVKWGAQTLRGKTKNTFILGYEKFRDGKQLRVYGDYLNERKIEDVWFDEFPVSYYHKPISKIFKEITSAGFKITDIIEPKAISQARKVRENFWRIHQRIPLFLIIEARKN